MKKLLALAALSVAFLSTSAQADVEQYCDELREVTWATYSNIQIGRDKAGAHSYISAVVNPEHLSDAIVDMVVDTAYEERTAIAGVDIEYLKGVADEVKAECLVEMEGDDL